MGEAEGRRRALGGTCGTNSHQTVSSSRKCSALRSEHISPSSICSTPTMIDSFILYEFANVSSF